MKRLLILLATLPVLASCGSKTTSVPETRAVSLGVTFSPVGLPDALTEETVTAFLDDVSAYGDVLAFHAAWRDDVQHAGQIPELARFAGEASRVRDFRLALGFGWADGEGNADLTSAGEPGNNSWSNTGTRAAFLDLVTEFARSYRPAFLFLGNETNTWWLANDGAGWDQWVSEYARCYAAVKDVSPSTQVFTVFQLERMAGLGVKNGWSDAAHWQLIGDFAPNTDGIGFTTYPYFEFETPAGVPDAYYDAIRTHWNGTVCFTEVGWLTSPAEPYTGSEQEQAAFVGRFFALTSSLPVGYATYVFLNDPRILPAAFAGIGLRTAEGVPRAADAVWRTEVENRRSGRR
jgi:hypothetical protein